MATPDGYSGWLLRMATPDGYSGWLLWMATLDGYSGLLRTTPDYSGWLRCPGCSYIVTITESNNINVSPDSGWLLRTTPDYTGWLRQPQGLSVPSPRASLALGKPPTRLPVSPVLVPSTSTIAGSVACALRPHDPN